MKSSSRFRLLAAVSAVALSVVAAGADSAFAAGPRGGTLVFARHADSLKLDPVLNDANVDIWVLTNLYETLITPSNDGKSLTPGLATKWAASADGKTFTVTLREGTKFSDGSPITAEDVVWSLDRARDPKEGIWNFLLASIAKVEATDATTVVLTLKNPDPSLPAALATFNSAVMPKKLVTAAAGATDDDRALAFAEHPVGSGPFMLSSWQRGSLLRLVRNPYYWRDGDDGKKLPYLDGVDFPVIPDDSTRILKLRAGEVDGAEFIPFARIAELKGDPKINMELFPSTEVDYLTVNDRPKLADGSDNPMANETVRQALNYAINKTALIQIVTHGIGTPMHSFMSSTTPLFADQGPAYPYDLAKAKALLAKAGYPNGLSISTLALAGNADELTTVSALQQMWSQIGVKLTIEQVDNATRDARYHKPDFQMRTGNWTNDINDPNEITSYFADYTNIENQHSGWDSKEADALFAASQSEADPVKRADQYAKIQAIYMQAAPIFFLYEVPYPVALGKNVSGFYQTPLGNNVFVRATVSR